MANNSIELVGLDFDTLKTSLKTYLKSQSKFADYNFDGSNMSVLLDILSYNTYQNAFYLNMVASEMFLDSAQLRNSVVSIAKALNYTPRSNKSAQATITARFAQSNLSTFTIPEGTRFIGKNSNTNFTFVTDENVVLYPSNGYFTANNLQLYEGSIFVDSYISNYAVENQRFIISNDTVDTNSVKVLVKENSNSTNAVYIKSSSLYNVNSTSNVFFIQAADRNQFEVVFGDGTFGRRPKNGAVISIQYRSTNGIDGNDTTDFTLIDNLGTYNGFGSAINPTITVINAAYGGANAETIDEIRYRAPKYFQTQDRAITENDFSSIITQRYQDIKSVYVYGGETVMGAPQYGRVFVSPLTFSGEPLTNTEKTEIEAYVGERSTIGISPVVIDSDRLYLVVTSDVLFTQSETTKTARDIETAVKTAIETFNNTYMKDFNTTFRQSKFEAVIDGADHAVYSNSTEVIMKKIAYVDLNIKNSLEVKYRNNIQPGTITSSSFISGGRTYQYTDYNPNVNTITVAPAGNDVVITNSVNTIYLKDITVSDAVSYTPAGTVDYAMGQINLTAIMITDLLNELGVNVYAKPPYGNISARENDVIEIDMAELTVSVSKVT